MPRNCSCPGGREDVGWPSAVGRVCCHRHRNLGRGSGCLRGYHQQDRAGLGPSGHPDRVGVHMAEPANVDAATVHGNATGSTVPGVQVERHPGDRPKGRFQARDEVGELGIRILRAWPPSAVQGAPASHRGIQAQPQRRRCGRCGGRNGGGAVVAVWRHVVGSVPRFRRPARRRGVPVVRVSAGLCVRRLVPVASRAGDRAASSAALGVALGAPASRLAWRPRGRTGWRGR
jgi:hypothetical protein